jgi:hypothetical protein
MHTTANQSAQPLGILTEWTPSRWPTRLRSILSNRPHRKNGEPEYDSLSQLDDRLLADVGLYREHRSDHPQNRTDQRRAAPVPIALLAIWAPL